MSACEEGLRFLELVCLPVTNSMYIFTLCADSYETKTSFAQHLSE